MRGSGETLSFVCFRVSFQLEHAFRDVVGWGSDAKEGSKEEEGCL